MTDQLSLNRNIASTPLYLFDRSGNKIFIRILFVFNSCCIIPSNGLFIIVIYRCMSTTICDTTALFTFFLFMRLNINIVTSCDPVIVIFAPGFFIIKA